MNLFGLLDQTASRLGDRGAVYCGKRQVHTWAELRDRALRLAATLGPPGTRVAQGFLEASGVNPVSETMRMIEASRAFETNINMMKFQDESLARLLTAARP